MEYKALDGSIYCRPALTPPIINSEIAKGVGLMAFSDIDLESGGNVPLKPGSNVKLRVILEGGARRITCHAKISGFHKDESSRKTTVFFNQLSLSDSEFHLLLNYMVDDSTPAMEFASTLRPKGLDADPLAPAHYPERITRVKAVTMPVSLIEMIDERRGGMRFSDYVCAAVLSHMNR